MRKLRLILVLWLVLAGIGHAFSVGSPSTLVTAGVVATNSVRVGGLYYFAVQTTTIGSDVYKIQVSLNNSDWEDLVTISANGVTQFYGVFDAIKAVKSSGSGTTARVILLGLDK